MSKKAAETLVLTFLGTLVGTFIFILVSGLNGLIGSWTVAYVLAWFISSLLTAFYIHNFLTIYPSRLMTFSLGMFCPVFVIFIVAMTFLKFLISD